MQRMHMRSTADQFLRRWEKVYGVAGRCRGREVCHSILDLSSSQWNIRSA